MGLPCSDFFSINVNGGDIDCTINMKSALENQSIDLEDALPGVIRAIPFTYSVGKPKRTVFASSYTKTRMGGASGVPPDLVSRRFNHQPWPNLEPKEVDDAVFYVEIPSYSDEVDPIGTGTDTYDITLWLREANVRIGGDNPPDNLEPANPQ